MFKQTIIAAVLALPLVAHSASWFQFEASLGHTQYNGLADGTWIQYGQPHSVALSAPAIELGVVAPILDAGGWGINAHVDYFNLGKAESQCTCNPHDEDYSTTLHRAIAHHSPDADFIGSGTVQGVKATAEVWKRVGNLRVAVEAGPLIFRPDWNETIYNWTVDSSPPRTITSNIPHTLRLGAVVGASVSSGPWSVVYQHYFLSRPVNQQMLMKSADVITLRYRF